MWRRAAWYEINKRRWRRAPRTVAVVVMSWWRARPWRRVVMVVMLWWWWRRGRWTAGAVVRPVVVVS